MTATFRFRKSRARRDSRNNIVTPVFCFDTVVFRRAVLFSDPCVTRACTVMQHDSRCTIIIIIVREARNYFGIACAAAQCCCNVKRKPFAISYRQNRTYLVVIDPLPRRLFRRASAYQKDVYL